MNDINKQLMQSKAYAVHEIKTCASIVMNRREDCDIQLMTDDDDDETRLKVLMTINRLDNEFVSIFRLFMKLYIEFT